MADRYYRFTGGGGIPDGIKYLLIWNGIVYLLQKILAHSGFFLEPLFGMVPVDFWQGHVWQCVTYMFLHGGIFHILINMFILWMFGSDLERILGTRRFIACYFFSGVGAGLLNAAVTPHAPIPTVGASGAIYGVLVGYALYFPERRVLLYFFIPIPVRVFVLIFGVIELLSAITLPGDSIAHVAHLGGLFFGWIFLRWRAPNNLWQRWAWRRRRKHLRVVDFTRDNSQDRWR